MPDGSLQAALPREMYVDPGTWLAEREVALFGQWFCLGRTDDLGLDATSRVASERHDAVSCTHLTLPTN